MTSRRITADAPDEKQDPFDSRKVWMRADCDRFEAQGLLPKYYELLDGRIVPKSGQGMQHGMCKSRAFFRLAQFWNHDQVVMGCLLDVAAEDRETNFPQPDVFVCDQSILSYNRDISGSDTLLVVEIADTTLEIDLTTKATLCARASTPELWVVDLRDRKLYVHRQPQNGLYRDVAAFSKEEQVAPLAAPEQAIRVSDLLTPEPEESRTKEEEVA